MIEWTMRRLKRRQDELLSKQAVMVHALQRIERLELRLDALAAEVASLERKNP